MTVMPDCMRPCVQNFTLLSCTKYCHRLHFLVLGTRPADVPTHIAMTTCSPVRCDRAFRVAVGCAEYNIITIRRAVVMIFGTAPLLTCLRPEITLASRLLYSSIVML